MQGIKYSGLRGLLWWLRAYVQHYPWADELNDRVDLRYKSGMEFQHRAHGDENLENLRPTMPRKVPLLLKHACR